MDDWQTKRLTVAELKDFFVRRFPHGFAGADVRAEIAPGELGEETFRPRRWGQGANAPPDQRVEFRLAS